MAYLFTGVAQPHSTTTCRAALPEPTGVNTFFIECITCGFHSMGEMEGQDTNVATSGLHCGGEPWWGGRAGAQSAVVGGGGGGLSVCGSRLATSARGTCTALHAANLLWQVIWLEFKSSVPGSAARMHQCLFTCFQIAAYNPPV